MVGDTPCPPNLEPEDLGKEATLVLDGQAHVIAMGKRQKAKTVGDFADIFIASVLQGEEPSVKLMLSLTNTMTCLSRVPDITSREEYPKQRSPSSTKMGEFINNTGKKDSGIVGITKTTKLLFKQVGPLLQLAIAHF